MNKSKNYKASVKTIDRNKVYSVDEAVDLLKSVPQPKFDQTVEISCKLNIDPKKSDQMVRGSTILPHGTGKKIKIMVFCEPDKEDSAKKAGADYAGSDDYVEKITKENWLDFDYCIATPQMMKVVSRLGKVLGPRGLMPSPKTGSVTDNIEAAVNEAKKGKIDFRTDKTGCVHAGVGKVSFSKEALSENINEFIKALNSSRPAVVKGDFLRSVYLSLTMSPSIRIEG